MTLHPNREEAKTTQLWLIIKQWVSKDTNRDGAISSADKPLLRGKGVPRPLAELDTNNDGVVSGTELIAAAKTMADQLQARFLKKYDSVPAGATAGDGTITADESLAVHQNAVAARVQAILDRYDLNHDGTVTSAEIEEVHSQIKKGPKGPHPGPARR